MITNGYIKKHEENVALGTLNSGLTAGKQKPRPLLAQTDPAPVQIDPSFGMRGLGNAPKHPATNGKRSVTLVQCSLA